MQHSAQKASGQREERVPLAAVVSVREYRQGREPSELEADGLNVSIGGIAMRARFAPQAGSVLECTFACPPTGELVSAQGEVVWSESHGPGQAEFGMRFVELDTKSATALRRMVSKAGAEPPQKPRSRVAIMQIDGLQGGVEAELKLVDETRVVLEQPLTFLQLGRGVDLTVPGRGQERGRIASIELKHGPFGAPRLVFGILLDAPVKVTEQVSSPWTTQEDYQGLHAVKASASAWGKRASEDELLEQSSEVALEPQLPPVKSRADYIAEARAALGEIEATETLQGIGQAPLALVEEQAEPEERWVPEAEEASMYVQEDEPLELTEYPPIRPELDERYASPAVSEPVYEEADEETEPLTLRTLPAHARMMFSKQLARISPTLREQAENLSLPDLKERVLAWFARVRFFVLALLKRRPRETSEVAEPSARRAPRLRVQRSTSPGLGVEEEGDEPNQNGRRTMIAVAVGLAAVGLIAYALAPGSTPAKVELPARIEEEAPLAEVPVVDEPVAVEVKPSVAPAAAKKPAPVVKEEAPAPPPFGEAEVPNGRVFTLRMNGPITQLEGQVTENGFTVKVPGRNPVDPARPIASAHRAVKRALFMNQGKYAELTLEFLPGFAPRYQVRAKGDALEITLERL